MYGLSSDAEEFVPARSKIMSEQKIPPTFIHHENENSKVFLNNGNKKV